MRILGDSNTRVRSATRALGVSGIARGISAARIMVAAWLLLDGANVSQDSVKLRREVEEEAKEEDKDEEDEVMKKG